MILKKTYYSISEVSKMLSIQEHTIRFWDSKIPNLSKELLSVLGFEFVKEIQDDSEIIKLIEKRNQLRANKEYDKADKIRNDLLSMGIEILDSKEGTNFRRI